MDAADSTIGHRLRVIRRSRGKSLAVIAGLAGISEGYLSRLERGECALDRRSLLVALAHALEVAPSELTRLPVPAPSNGGIDAAIEAMRLTLMAVSHNQPGGQVLPVEALQARVRATLDSQRRCDQDDAVGTGLPGLIRDLHTAIAAGRDVAQLLELVVLLHTQGTASWLRVVGAPLDLRFQAVLLARQAAHDRDEPAMLGVATVGAVSMMLAAGAFDLAQAELDSVRVRTTSPDSAQLAGMLALSGSLVAVANNRPVDAAARSEYAVELAERTGEGNAYWMGFGPTNVGLWRMACALEAGDHEQAVSIAEGLRPEEHSYRSRQAAYWVDYGRSLARLRGRRDDAVRALRRAETISPNRVRRNPFARGTLAELVTRSRDDALGREVRGMAYRAGLPG